MNAERLLAHYDKLADAPDAIARLRRFVLDLAVRGKLVPQDANDEPTSELLKRVAKEKLDQADLPKGWRRAKVGSILDFQYGKGLKASERPDEGPVPVFGSNGIVGFTDEPLTVRSSIIVGRKGSAGALNLCDGPSWTTDVAYFVEAPSFIEIRFLLNALKVLDLDKLGKGVKPGLSRSEAYDQIISVPPLAEQHRIVAKVDELMALCDQLEAARGTREAVRDRTGGGEPRPPQCTRSRNFSVRCRLRPQRAARPHHAHRPYQGAPADHPQPRRARQAGGTGSEGQSIPIAAASAICGRERHG
jgi:type I restriction enzyme, S subunit